MLLVNNESNLCQSFLVDCTKNLCNDSILVSAKGSNLGNNQSKEKGARLQVVIQVLIMKIKRGKRHHGKHPGNKRVSVEE